MLIIGLPPAVPGAKTSTNELPLVFHFERTDSRIQARAPLPDQGSICNIVSTMVAILKSGLHYFISSRVCYCSPILYQPTGSFL
jgi:hypothetical protein